ncbi:MAG: GNAT family N-acetyltransferase [Pseudomonadota bacterium]
MSQDVRVRSVTADDADALQAMLSHGTVATMLADVPWPYPNDGAATFIATHTPTSDTYQSLDAVTFTPYGGDCVGFVSLRRASRALRLSYFAAPVVWGRGVVTAAVGQVLDRTFDRDPNVVVEAGVFNDNPASARVLHKLGFEPHAAAFPECSAKGDTVGIATYRLTADLWRSRTVDRQDATTAARSNPNR